MPLPEEVQRNALVLMAQFCLSMLPEDIWAEGHLHFHIRANSITLYKRYAARDRALRDWDRLPVAKFTYDLKQGVWTLHYSDDARRWHPYEGILPSPDLGVLIAEVSRDPRAVFLRG